MSVLARLISDSILVGFKAGAALTIIIIQLPNLLGIVSGGHDFFERAIQLIGRLDQTNYIVLAIGAVATLALLSGERLLPGRPVALGVVAIAIIAASGFGLPSFGVPITGAIPAGLPSLTGPALRLRDVEGVFPLAAGCLLLAYIESVSAARTFAGMHGYSVDTRQEFLGIAFGKFARKPVRNSRHTARANEPKTSASGV